MLSKLLQKTNLFKETDSFKKINVLKKIYDTDNYLIKLERLSNSFYKDLFLKNLDVSKYSKPVLDELIYLYEKYNFFVYNDIKIILFILSACGSLENFKVFYEIFKKKYSDEEETLETLKNIFLVSILYDNINVFKFLTFNNKEKKIIEIIINEKIGTSIFLLAARYGSVKILNYFISKGIDINTKDKDYKKTALMWAAENEHLEVVKLLVESLVNLNEKDDDGNTALIKVSSFGNIEILKLLIENGADLNERNNEGKNAFMKAAENERINTFEFLLNKILEGRKKIKDNEEIKKYNNKYLDARDIGGRTALILSVFWSDRCVKILKMLIESGVDINARDNEGKTALMHAAERGHVKKAKLLIESGANLDEKDNDNKKTALFYAVENNKVEIVKLLIESGANLEARIIYEKTALMLAVYNNYLDIVCLLIKAGANLEAKDKGGNTALMYASVNRYSSLQVVQLLVKSGAKIDETNNSGKTAIDSAKTDEIKQFLLQELEKQNQQQNKS